MTTRNRTQLFLQCRKGFLRKTNLEKPRNPEWMDMMKEIELMIDDLGSKVHRLSSVHKKNRVMFLESEDEEMEHDAREIALFFKKLEAQILKFQSLNLESTVHRNAAISLVKRLGLLSQDYRKSQTNQLTRTFILT